MAASEKHLKEYLASLGREDLTGFAGQLHKRTGVPLSYSKDTSDAGVRDIILRECQRNEKLMEAALREVDDAWPEQPPQMGFKPNK